MKTGFYYDMPFEEYAKIDALNGSSLVKMMRSPMHYRHHKLHPETPTREMVLGTAAHRMILEPDTVGDFAVYGLNESENVRRGKVWDAFQEANQGKFLVNEKEMAAMVGISVAVRRSKSAMKYLGEKGPTEVVMVWRDGDGRLWKGRVDKIIDRQHIIPDLKTTNDCRPFRFGARSYAMGYHIKMAIYSFGYYTLTKVQPKLRMIAIEQDQPHESAVYRIPPDVLIQGSEELQNLVQQLTACEKSGIWPGAVEDETDLALPAYAMTSAEDLAEFEIAAE